MRNATVIAASLAAALAAAPGSALAEKIELRSDLNIVENTVDASRFDALLAAIQTADLDQRLQYRGPFTMFAPTDAAFAELDASPRSEEAMRAVLGCHVVAGDLDTDALASRMAEAGGAVTLETITGCEITVSGAAEDGLTVSSGGVSAAVIAPDLDPINGTMHAIDTVLMP